jgi:hypothetical protein
MYCVGWLTARFADQERKEPTVFVIVSSSKSTARRDNMGIFFTADRPAAPVIHAALADALTTNPGALGGAPEIAKRVADKTKEVVQATTPKFNLRNFIVAALISAALLITAICIDKSHPDISKTLMTSFTSFSGIVLGLLGGEAQKSTS